MSYIDKNGKFNHGKWQRDKVLAESLNDPVLKKLRTLPKGTMLPPISTWWEAQPEDLMTAVYWQKGQLPPREPAKFEKAYNDIVKQLHKMYPIPADVLPKLDIDDETERAIAMDAPAMAEGKEVHLDDLHHTEKEKVDKKPKAKIGAENDLAIEKDKEGNDIFGKGLTEMNRLKKLAGLKEAPMASGPMVSGIEFQPGDMWSNDFDYVGMLKYSAEMEIPEDPNALLGMTELLNKLFDSYEDVNYHSEARDLGIAIDYIEDAKGIEDLERAQDLLANHQKAAAKTLKDITRR